MPRDRFAGHRFTILLAAQLLFLLTTVIVHDALGGAHKRVQAFVGVVAFSLVMGAGGLVFVPLRGARWLIGVVAVVVTLQFTNLFLMRDDIRLLERLLWIGLMSYAFVLAVRALFRTRVVTAGMMSEALCAYALLGLIWAGIYAIIEQVSPGAFSAPLSVTFEDIEVTTQTLYFSFVTMFTLGYGDIVPLSATARAFAIIETFAGQVLLVVLIARLVGLHVAQTSE